MGQRAIYVIPVTLLLLAECSLALGQEFPGNASRGVKEVSMGQRAIYVIPVTLLAA